MKLTEKIRSLFNIKNKDRLVGGFFAAAAVAAGLFTVSHINSTMSKQPCLELYYNGERVGCVASQDVYAEAKADAERYLANTHAVGFKFVDESVSYRMNHNCDASELLDKEDVARYLANSANSYFSQGYGLYVDGTLVAIGADKSDVQSLIDETVSLYSRLYAKVKAADDIISFNSSIRIEQMSVPTDSISTYEEIRHVLGLDNLDNLNSLLLRDNGASDAMTVHDITDAIPQMCEVTYGDISLGLPSENIISDNVQDDSEREAVMSFKSDATEVVIGAIPYGETIVAYDKSVLEGTKVLVENGVYGVRESKYNIEYIDGVEISRTLINEVIIKEPVPAQYKMGTMSKAEYERNQRAAAAKNSFVYAAPGETAAIATGVFKYPTTGTITSTFSGRNLFGEYEFHGALDIANKRGTDIYASDGGTVTLAEPFSTYGNCIIIDHGNGYQTLYAHLDKYSVVKGDQVGQGWKIGEMGDTGRATGYHLHFEVRVNGERCDPLDYLSK